MRRMDPGERATEAEYLLISRRLRGIYGEAQMDLRMKLASFEHAHKARVEKYRAEVAAGKITEADFQAWMKGQLFQEQAWKQKQQQLAYSMAHVDEQALAMVNDGKTRVFGENANYIAWQTERKAGMNLGFGLYDRGTVNRLVREQPRLLPMPKIDEGKDVKYYNRAITNAITQGILQGESLDEIIMRISTDLGEKGLNGMRRNARTAYTGAQNAGRMEGLRKAQELGVEVKKQWMATLDDSTRDAHQELDGQTAEVDEPFQSSLGPIMYPGDPDADPANVYNCRCTLVYQYTKFPASLDRVDDSGEHFGNMTYRQWKEAKGGG